MKAAALVSDIVEDYYMTYNGEIWESTSQYISIS